MKYNDRSNSGITQDAIKVYIKGHCRIEDQYNNVLLDKDNDIHPQNMSRVIARALSNEHNGCIYRIAFGNGGTTTNMVEETIIKPANVGSWDSRLYNETYSEIVDDGFDTLNPDLGVDPGSADINTNIRAGGGSVPSSDPISVIHTSGPGVRSVESGTISEIVIRSVINSSEPSADVNRDGPVYNMDSAYAFDEIGLYTGGAPAIATTGYQYINIGTNKTSEDISGLSTNTTYSLIISVDGGSDQTITFTTPSAGTGPSDEILYGDLCQGLNSASWGATLPVGVVISITDTSDRWESIIGARTYGKLKISSSTTGDTSRIDLTLVPELYYSFLNFSHIEPSVPGQNAGYKNSPTSPERERERLLTHLTFPPIIKNPSITLTVTYTITVTVTAPQNYIVDYNPYGVG